MAVLPVSDVLHCADVPPVVWLVLWGQHMGGRTTHAVVQQLAVQLQYSHGHDICTACTAGACSAWGCTAGACSAHTDVLPTVSLLGL